MDELARSGASLPEELKLPYPRLLTGDFLFIYANHWKAEFAVINRNEAHADFVANVQDFFNFLKSTAFYNLRNVEHAVNSWHNIHKRTEIFNRHYCTVVNFTYFWFFGERLDPF